MGHVVKSEEPGFERNLLNRALLNTDNSALAMYKARRAKEKNQLSASQRLDNLEAKVDRLIALFEQVLEQK